MQNQRTDTPPREALSLDDVAALSIPELDALYATGTVPDTLEHVDGDPECRMLTVVGPLGRGLPAELVRRLARWERFPWAGKAFHAFSDAQGRGINRVRLDREREWFPFDYHVAPSELDGQPCIVLDYEQPENPWFIRAIHDEIREVSPGLYVGPAMAKLGGRKALVLYFAVSFAG